MKPGSRYFSRTIRQFKSTYCTWYMFGILCGSRPGVIYCVLGASSSRKICTRYTATEGTIQRAYDRPCDAPASCQWWGDSKHSSVFTGQHCLLPRWFRLCWLFYCSAAESSTIQSTSKAANREHGFGGLLYALIRGSPRGTQFATGRRACDRRHDKLLVMRRQSSDSKMVPGMRLFESSLLLYFIPHHPRVYFDNRFSI